MLHFCSIHYSISLIYLSLLLLPTFYSASHSIIYISLSHISHIYVYVRIFTIYTHITSYI
jgi:hypothetical protein